MQVSERAMLWQDKKAAETPRVTRQELIASMPKIGTKLVRKPGYAKTKYNGGKDPLLDNKPQECEVIEVYPKKLWYRVRYRSGFTEGIKVGGNEE